MKGVLIYVVEAFDIELCLSLRLLLHSDIADAVSDTTGDAIKYCSRQPLNALKFLPSFL